MKRNLCEQGYYVARDLLADHWVENVLDDMCALVKSQAFPNLPSLVLGDYDNHMLLSALKILLESTPENYLGTIRAFSRLMSLQNLLTSTYVIEALEGIGFKKFATIPVSPVVIVMSDKLKVPGGYHGLKPHQDWTSTQGSLDTVTVWVPLHDVSKNNFPLEVIPGSHLRGVWPGKRNGSYYEIDKSEYKDSDFVPLEVKQGDVVIMSGFTVHRTGVKDSKGLRIAASIRFDNSAEPSFIKRNYPCMYSRTLKQEWQDDKLPGTEEMKGIFGI